MQMKKTSYNKPKWETIPWAYNQDKNLLGSNLKPFENNKQKCLWACQLQNHSHSGPFSPFQFQQIYLIHSLIELDQSALPRVLDQSFWIKKGLVSWYELVHIDNLPYKERQTY